VRQFRGCKIVSCIGAVSGFAAPWYVDSGELKLEEGEVPVRLAPGTRVHTAFPPMSLCS
jgi:hypothetical protein